MAGAELGFFIGFIVFIIFVLMIDLGVFSSKKSHGHIVSAKEALVWTLVWVCLALGLFFLLRFKGEIIHGVTTTEQLNLLVSKYQHLIILNGSTFQENLQIYNNNLSIEYITGYVIEYALSVDNIFVMIMIFMSFGVESKYYHRVLFWGILGAIIMRFFFIFVSAALIERFTVMLYFFGALLIFTGVKMFLSRNKDDEINPEKHPVVRFASKYFSVYPRNLNHEFFIRENKKNYITPLFLVLLVIEFSDVIFAVDSVPAIFSVTKDPYIVFFSNIFAILGLRSLFFLIVNVINLFHYLKHGLAILLTFIGLKMIFHSWLKEFGFTTSHSLFIILGILVLSILASLIFPKKTVIPKL